MFNVYCFHVSFVTLLVAEFSLLRLSSRLRELGRIRVHHRHCRPRCRRRLAHCLAGRRPQGQPRPRRPPAWQAVFSREEVVERRRRRRAVAQRRRPNAVIRILSPAPLFKVIPYGQSNGMERGVLGGGGDIPIWLVGRHLWSRGVSSYRT